MTNAQVALLAAAQSFGGMAIAYSQITRRAEELLDWLDAKDSL